MTTLPKTSAVAVETAALAATAGPTPTGYVTLDDKALVERMLSNIADNVVLLEAVKAHHVMDKGGQLATVFAWLAGMEEAEAIAVRQVRNIIGGA